MRGTEHNHSQGGKSVIVCSRTHPPYGKCRASLALNSCINEFGETQTLSSRVWDKDMLHFKFGTAPANSPVRQCHCSSSGKDGGARTGIGGRSCDIVRVLSIDLVVAGRKECVAGTIPNGLRVLAAKVRNLSDIGRHDVALPHHRLVLLVHRTEVTCGRGSSRPPAQVQGLHSRAFAGEECADLLIARGVGGDYAAECECSKKQLG